MKKVFAILGILAFFGCEEVIQVELPTAEPRLSIDALVRVDTSETLTKVQIKANTTNGYFDDVTPADLTAIRIVNASYTPSNQADSNTLTLTKTSPGVYEAEKRTEFFTNGELQLIVEHAENRYEATTNYVRSTPITFLEQGDEVLFDDVETEIKVAFQDLEDQSDFYLFDLDFGEYLVTNDAFYEGQLFQFSYFYDAALEEGDEVTIKLLGVNEPFFNYMNQLIVQAGGDQGPFQTPAATVRGNIVKKNASANNTNANDLALGYFAVCQTFSKSIVIE